MSNLGRGEEAWAAPYLKLWRVTMEETGMGYGSLRWDRAVLSKKESSSEIGKGTVRMRVSYPGEKEEIDDSGGQRGSERSCLAVLGGDNGFEEKRR